MEVLTHKCPNCDGPLTFNPTDQKFHCPFCQSVFTESQVTTFEENQTRARDITTDESNTTQSVQSEPVAQPVTDESTQMSLFVCPSCGAEIVTEATTAATYCYFCHNPVVLSGRLSGEFLPNKVLPFSISEKEAKDTFLTWATKKWFVPKDFFSAAQVEKLTGVYFPYWVVDAQADGELSGMGTNIRVWQLGETEYTETKRYEVFRQGDIFFKDLVKNALSKNIQQKMVESVQPFPIEKAVTFKSQYLAGFQAEKRDIDYASLKQDIDSELKNYGETILRNSVGGYTSFIVKRHDQVVTNETSRYMLLPVWLVTYSSTDQSKTRFYYAMNGQTGKVSGILPISYKKLALASGGLFGLLLVLFMIVGYFL